MMYESFFITAAVAVVLAFAGMAAPPRLEPVLYWGAIISGTAAAWSLFVIAVVTATN